MPIFMITTRMEFIVEVSSKEVAVSRVIEHLERGRMAHFDPVDGVVTTLATHEVVELEPEDADA